MSQEDGFEGAIKTLKHLLDKRSHILPWAFIEAAQQFKTSAYLKNNQLIGSFNPADLSEVRGVYYLAARKALEDMHFPTPQQIPDAQQREEVSTALRAVNEFFEQEYLECLVQAQAYAQRIATPSRPRGR